MEQVLAGLTLFLIKIYIASDMLLIRPCELFWPNSFLLKDMLWIHLFSLFISIKSYVKKYVPYSFLSKDKVWIISLFISIKYYFPEDSI